MPRPFRDQSSRCCWRLSFHKSISIANSIVKNSRSLRRAFLNTKKQTLTRAWGRRADSPFTCRHEWFHPALESSKFKQGHYYICSPLGTTKRQAKLAQRCSPGRKPLFTTPRRCLPREDASASLPCMYVSIYPLRCALVLAMYAQL